MTQIYYGNGIDHVDGTTVGLGIEPKIIIMRWCTNDWNTNIQFRVWVDPNLESTDYFYITGMSATEVSANSSPTNDFIVEGTKFTYSCRHVTERYMNYIAIG